MEIIRKIAIFFDSNKFDKILKINPLWRSNESPKWFQQINSIGIDARRSLTAKRIAMRNDSTTPGREKKREADEDLWWNGMERDCQRGFLRTRPASRWRRRALVQLRSSPVDTVSQYFTISWSNSRWLRNTVANSLIHMYLTREWIYNLVCRSLLYCDN